MLIWAEVRSDRLFHRSAIVIYILFFLFLNVNNSVLQTFYNTRSFLVKKQKEKVKLGKSMYAVLYMYCSNSVWPSGGWPLAFNEKPINK